MGNNSISPMEKEKKKKLKNDRKSGSEQHADK